MNGKVIIRVYNKKIVMTIQAEVTIGFTEAEIC